jgi:hypothetical protein
VSALPQALDQTQEQALASATSFDSRADQVAWKKFNLA